MSAIDDSKLGVWGKTPKTRVCGEVRWSRVVPIDSPPMVCIHIKVSSFYLVPSPSYSNGSIRDIHTHVHTYTHTHTHTHTGLTILMSTRTVPSVVGTFSGDQLKSLEPRYPPCSKHTVSKVTVGTVPSS